MVHSYRSANAWPTRTGVRKTNVGTFKQPLNFRPRFAGNHFDAFVAGEFDEFLGIHEIGSHPHFVPPVSGQFASGDLGDE
jgi:hypothetical protein